jgi:N-acetyl-anhydromuramyl-L-alanine amidase AmpD
MSTEQIKEIQGLLTKAGYPLDADGIAGPKTFSALLAFQLKTFATGEPNDATLKALKKAGERLPTAPKIAEIAMPYFLLPSEYINEVTPKNNVTLHLTAGSKSPHFTQQTWANDGSKGLYSIGTHFVVGGEFNFPQNPAFNSKDGDVLQCVPLENWVYHVNYSPQCNKNNIGIEICNWGPVIFKNGQYIVPSTGIVLPPEEVEQFDFRGFQHWHRITNAQLESTGKLILALADEYPEIKRGIKAQTFDEHWADYRESAELYGQKGVGTHTNYVHPSKNLRYDMPPTPRVLAMLKNVQAQLA